MLHEAEINRSLSTVDDRCMNQYVTCSTYSDLVEENKYAEGESLQSSIVPSISRRLGSGLRNFVLQVYFKNTQVHNRGSCIYNVLPR